MEILNFTHNNEVVSLIDLSGREVEYQALYKWLNDPEIQVWYDGRDKKYTLDEIRTKYGKKIGTNTVYPTMIKSGEVLIGYLHYYLIPKEGGWGNEYFEINYLPNMFAVDILIGEKEYLGKGIGSIIMNKLATYLLKTKKASRVYLDPRVVNERAVKSYEKAGFKKIKILKNHELFEGAKRDSWLMEFKF